MTKFKNFIAEEKIILIVIATYFFLALNEGLPSSGRSIEPSK
jgi:hypothetical protein